MGPPALERLRGRRDRWMFVVALEGAALLREQGRCSTAPPRVSREWPREQLSWARRKEIEMAKDVVCTKAVLLVRLSENC